MPHRSPRILPILIVLLVLPFSGCVQEGTEEERGDRTEGPVGEEEDDMERGTTETRTGEQLVIRSNAFGDGETIPTKHTCDGDDVSPHLSLGRMPEATRSVALIMDDPDAPQDRPFLHWMFWDLPSNVTTLDEGADPSDDGATVAENDFGNKGYGGPCPPEGHGQHRYNFRFYALDKRMGLSSDAGRDDLEKRMDGHILASGVLVGTYSRG